MHNGLQWTTSPPINDVELLTDRTQLAIARTMAVPFAAAMAGVVSLPVPACPIDRRWQRDTNGPFDRSDLASARTSGHINTGRRAVPVEIELAPWSSGVTELVIRPDVRAPQRWSGRRRRTWYASAHPVADALRQQIVDTQPQSLRQHRSVRDTTRDRLAG